MGKITGKKTDILSCDNFDILLPTQKIGEVDLPMELIIDSIDKDNHEIKTKFGEISNVKITGGSIDGTVIGGTTAAAGTFTTLSVSDGDITNVRSIACDSIVADDANVGLDIVFGGNTTTNKITLTDNLEDH